MRTLTNNRVESGIITASYYKTSERHKGANEGGRRQGGRVEVPYESCQRLIFPSVVGALIDKSRGHAHRSIVRVHEQLAMSVRICD